MDHRKACPRTLDRPIMIFGLEPEDLVLVGLVSGLILFTIDALPAVLAGAVLWAGLSRLKAGKPPGHLFECLYRAGLLRRAPGWMRAPQLLPRHVRTIDPFPGGPRDEIDAWWGERPRLDR
jgi:type IV secretory pathway TrbD component